MTDQVKQPPGAGADAATPTAGPGASDYVRPVLFAALVTVIVILGWWLRSVFLLLFGALILATALQASSLCVRRLAGLSPRWSFAITLILLTIAVVGVSWLVGDRLASQFGELRERLPAAAEAARAWLDDNPLGRWLVEAWSSLQEGGVSWEGISGAAGITAGAIGNAALMTVMGIFIAADPALYRDGLVRLAPVPYRRRIRSAIRAAIDGLSSWLLGQGISMLFVGAATAIGLALLGLPLALSLGVIAGVFAFIPFFGPIASGVLAVALAFIEGPQTALYVAGLCLLIQQIEGNLLMPFVQRWAVSLPPVLGVISVVVFGLLFGVMGIIFATPLMVVLMILVKELYVQDVLEAGGDTERLKRQDA